MRRVAREVNASTQVLYTMFGDKDGLADELLLQGFERLAGAHGAAPRPEDPLRHLYERLEVYIENALANPNYNRVMVFQARKRSRRRPPETSHRSNIRRANK